MTVKSCTKVVPRVKRFSPSKLVLHEVLRPSYMISYDSLIYYTMGYCNLGRKEAEEIVFKVLDYIEYNDLGYQDRDRLKLPNISDRYPRYPEITQYWKIKLEEPPE